MNKYQQANGDLKAIGTYIYLAEVSQSDIYNAVLKLIQFLK